MIAMVISGVAIVLSGVSAVFVILALREQNEANRANEALVAKAWKCRVYWGSHGCTKPRGHKGWHKCEKGCRRPIKDVDVLFGEDV